VQTAAGNSRDLNALLVTLERALSGLFRSLTLNLTDQRRMLVDEWRARAANALGKRKDAFERVAGANAGQTFGITPQKSAAPWIRWPST
jgi:hypothetical protein